MSRAWDPKNFDSIYAEFIQQNAFAVHYGSPNHYSRYRSRYKSLVKRFCSLAPATPVDVLDIGGDSWLCCASRYGLIMRV